MTTHARTSASTQYSLNDTPPTPRVRLLLPQSTFNGHKPRALALTKGFLRTATWLEWAEADWLRRHPPRAGKVRNLFVDCTCSYCGLLRRKGGNRDDPAVALVGVWRKNSENPGYTVRSDPAHAHLVAAADMRAHAGGTSVE